jgi:hypothetical protein
MRRLSESEPADQDIVPGEIRTIAELGITPTWGVEAQLPFRMTRTSIRYADLTGAPYQPLDPEVHHRNETLAGRLSNHSVLVAVALDANRRRPQTPSWAGGGPIRPPPS